MKKYDAAVIGGGPAGITAALYLVRAGVRTVLVEKLSPGGQVLMTEDIENYPGFPKAIKGYELVDKFVEHLASYDLDRMGERTFEESELESTKLFANLAAIVMQNVRQYERLEHTSAQLEGQLALRHRLLDLSTVLLGTLDLRAVFREITSNLKDMVDYDALDIRRLEAESRELVSIYLRDDITPFQLYIKLLTEYFGPAIEYDPNSEADLPELYRGLEAIGLNEYGAGTILDVTACPGTDTCKLGIASSRGLARELRARLAGKFFSLDAAVKGLRIKMSGCFNSCGQHHIADIGFYGNTRTIGSRKVPHFQVLLGGRWRNNAGSYGLAIGSVPAKNVPAVVERITERYVRDRQGTEEFQDFIARIGKAESRRMIEDLMPVPAYEKDPDFYRDWGDPREFSLGDMGMGECAGEVVSALQFELGAAERLNFEAQLAHEAGDFPKADELAYSSMLQAARGLVHELWQDVPTDPATVVHEFRSRFSTPTLFSGPLAAYLFQRHDQPPAAPTRETAHRLIEEAQLFIEGAHTCGDKLRQQLAASLKK